MIAIKINAVPWVVVATLLLPGHGQAQGNDLSGAAGGSAAAAEEGEAGHAGHGPGGHNGMTGMECMEMCRQRMQGQGGTGQSAEGGMQCMEEGGDMMAMCRRHMQQGGMQHEGGMAMEDGEHEHSEHGMGSMDHSRDHAGGSGEAGQAPDKAAGLIEPKTSDRGLFRVSVQPELEPLAINRLHSWTLHVEQVTGAPVEGADIGISGGMPGHGHGLPTAPRVTRELGGGDYLVEGMQFQMPGRWQVTFEIRSGSHSDSVTFDFSL